MKLSMGSSVVVRLIRMAIFVFSVLIGVRDYAFAAIEVVDGIAWTYVVSDGKAIVGDGTGPAISVSTSGSLRVPDKLGSAPVSAIGDSAFDGCSGLTSVELPSSLTLIGWCSFWGCSGLTSIAIPDGVSIIWDGAFEGCSGLTTITIPKSVVTIKSGAFYQCKSLTTICVAAGDAERVAGLYPFETSVKFVEFAPPENVNASDGLYQDRVRLSWKAADEARSYNIYRSTSNLRPLTETAVAVMSPYDDDDAVPGVKYYYWVEAVTPAGRSVSLSDIGYCAVSLSIGEESFSCAASGESESVTVAANSSWNVWSDVSWIKIEPMSGTGDGLFTCIVASNTTKIARTGVVVVKAGAGTSYPVSKTISVSQNAPNPFVIVGGNLTRYVGAGGDVVIPQSVSSIGDRAFENCNELVSITIPQGVTNIGAEAFMGCTELSSVTIPSSVAKIGIGAFRGCSGLTHMELPFVGAERGVTGGIKSLFGYIFGKELYEGATAVKQYYSVFSYATYYIPSSLRSITVTDTTRIGYGAFSDCRELTAVTLPECLIYLGEESFRDCQHLKSLTIPVGVESVAKSTFKGCYDLASIAMTVGVTNISDRAFCDCRSLSSISIPVGVTRIGDAAFCGCSGMTSIIIPADTAFLGGEVFRGCSELMSVTLPTNVTSIGYSAFQGCACLEEMSLPSSVTNIGARAFAGCGGLSSIEIPENATCIGISAFEGCTNLMTVTLHIGLTGIKQDAFKNCTALTSVVIPEGVLYVEGGSFSGCTALSSITVPSSVRVLGAAFSGCEKLMSVVIPDGVPEIKNQTFYGCKKLSSIALPSSITNIGAYAFADCAELFSISIPSGVMSIGGSAFSNCRGLHSVTIPDAVTKIESWTFYNCTSLQSVKMPDDVKEIGSYAFCGCNGLSSIAIPKGMKAIGDSAFASCRALAWVTIPVSVTNIGNRAFSFCSMLESVSLQGNSLRIGDSAFQYCKLKSVTLPPDVKNIAITAFTGNNFVSVAMPTCEVPLQQIFSNSCSSIREVNIREGATTIVEGAFCGCKHLESVTIPASVESIGNMAFADCANIRSVTIPRCVERLSDVFPNAYNEISNVVVCDAHDVGSYAFAGCSNLVTLTLPKGVTNIADHAFLDCLSLADIAIPDDVEQIGAYAYSGCGGLSSVTIPNKVMDIASGTFYGCTGLVSVTLSGELKTIGEWAFSECSALCSIVIPSGVTNIGCCAFNNCSSLSIFAIPTGVGEIQYGTFRSCGGLKYVSIPSGVKSIGDFAFADCSSLRSVIIPDGVRVIGQNAFQNCARMYSITIPQSITNIGSSVFSGCADLISIVIPEGVESIEPCLFDGCKGLESLSVPSSVATVGACALRGCESLLVVHAKKEEDVPRIRQLTQNKGIDISNIAFDSDSSFNYYKINLDPQGGMISSEAAIVRRLDEPVGELPTAVRNEHNFLGWFTFAHGGTQVTSETVLSESATLYAHWSDEIEPINRSLGWKTWMDDRLETWCYCLATNDNTIVLYNIGAQVVSPEPYYMHLYLPDKLEGKNVTRIGRNSFWGFSGFYGVDIPKTTIRIGSGAFWRTSIGTVELPASLVEIGNEAFYASGLQSVKIPSNVRSIGRQAFSLCSNLSAIQVDGDNCYFKSDMGLLLNKTGDVLITVPSGRSDAIGVSIPSGVKSIECYAFYGCSKLTEVVIPDGVKKVGDSAFCACGTLKTVSIPQTLKYIGTDAFAGCNSLETVRVSAGDSDRVRGLYPWPKNIEFVDQADIVVDGDNAATIVGSYEAGYVVKPSEGKSTVEVIIPQSLNAEKVTVEVSPNVMQIIPHGAKLRIFKGADDITDFLIMPCADVNGVVDLTRARVREEIVNESIDIAQGAVIDITKDDPVLRTSNTRKGLVYTLREGESLNDMIDGDSKVGDGQPWTPKITVKGGSSGFYSITVTK